MKVASRRQAILDRVRTRPATVEALADEFRISVATVRRDLTALAEAGNIVRTYGGAAAAAGLGEQSLAERAELALAEKRRIARAAVALIGEARMVYVDAGTTAGAVAEEIAARAGEMRGLTVVTHGLNVARILADLAEIELVVLGGTLRRMSQGMLGPLTEEALSHFTLDAAVLGADAVSSRFGLGETTLVQSSLKRAVMARSARIVVVADASKLEAETATCWAAVPRGATLVTDAVAPSVPTTYEGSGYRVLSV